MNNEQQAETTEFNSVDTVLTNWNSTWTGNVATSDAVTEFRLRKLTNHDLAIETGADNSGFSQNKLIAKTNAANEAATLTGIAYVRFKKLGRNDLANQLDISVTNFTQASDGNSETLLNANSKLMRDNISLLNPDYVTPTEVDALDELIVIYEETQGTSTSVHSASPEIQAQFNDSFAPVKEEIDFLKLIVKKQFKLTFPKFYDQLAAASKLPTVNVHHTIMSMHATKKSDGSVVEGLLISETKSGKNAVTNYLGDATINEVKNGTDVMTAIYNGQPVYTGHINNKRGHNNHYNIIVESL